MVDYATAYVYLVSALTRGKRADSGGIMSIQEPGSHEYQYNVYQLSNLIILNASPRQQVSPISTFFKRESLISQSSHKTMSIGAISVLV